jgi:pimeloyl-ACP methyl ester carboxylesterase
MLLNTLNLSGQLPEWQLDSVPERAVLLSAPTTMRTPVSKLASRLNLSAQALLLFRAAIRQHSETNIKHLNFRNFIQHGRTPVLCIHGKDDHTIDPNESIVFCRRYPHASLVLIPGVDHVGVLIDKRVEDLICNFLL